MYIQNCIAVLGSNKEDTVVDFPQSQKGILIGVIVTDLGEQKLGTLDELGSASNCGQFIKIIKGQRKIEDGVWDLFEFSQVSQYRFNCLAHFYKPMFVYISNQLHLCKVSLVIQDYPFKILVFKPSLLNGYS